MAGTVGVPRRRRRKELDGDGEKDDECNVGVVDGVNDDDDDEAEKDGRGADGDERGALDGGGAAGGRGGRCEEPIVAGDVGGYRAPDTGGCVARDDGKRMEGWKRKLTRRVTAAICMFTCFLVVLRLGHESVAFGVVLLQFRLFHELVRVGYAEMKESRRNKSEIPLFRTMQWAWFVVALTFSYQLDTFKAPMFLFERVTGRLLNVNDEHMLLDTARKYFTVTTFTMYVMAFCATILLLKKDLYRYQIRVLSFTFLVLALVVLQLKVAIHNVFTGMIWFLLPVMLILTNDTGAYVFGKSLGRKIFRNWEFLRLSPNKTWEGYIGGGIATMLMGWYFPLVVGNRRWLVCSFRELQLARLDEASGAFDPTTSSIACNYDSMFERQDCSLASGLIRFGCLPAQVHGLVLSIFASIVAPFGGFFASAIKRAYNIDDFDSVIPGHGGAMDRLDCQFIMAMATYVHCKTFLPGMGDVVNDVMDAISELNEEQVREVYERVSKLVHA